jgi:hypothetical protein
MTFFFLTWSQCTYSANPEEFHQTLLGQGVEMKRADLRMLKNEA